MSVYPINRNKTLNYIWYTWIVIFTALTGLGSCNKEEILNPVPTTRISDVNAFDTPERILALVNGIYTSLKSGSFYGGGYLLHSEVRGEDFINRTSNINSGFATWNHTVNSTSVEVMNIWSSGYSTINSVNIFLAGIEEHPGVVSDSLAKQYKAEARFLRAVSYYSLVILYARPYVEDNGISKGLPLRLVPETSPLNNALKRSTVAEVYNQILDDLDYAEAHLPLKHSTPLLNTTRAHRNTVIAFKTRVYLTIGNYAKVIEEAQKIVSPDAPYRALTGVANQLQASATAPFLSDDYTTTESVFSMPMTAQNSSTGYSSLGYDLNSTPSGNGEYNLNPQGIIADAEWRETDTRRQFITTGTTKFFRKYSKGNPYLDYVPVIRYPEILLNYAEALANTGDLDKARSLLLWVRHRADAGYNFPEEKVTEKTALISTIWHERRIELLGEGFRSGDLLRTLRTIPGKGTVGPVAPADEQYIFPLPSTELNTNPDL